MRGLKRVVLLLSLHNLSSAESGVAAVSEPLALGNYFKCPMRHRERYSRVRLSFYRYDA